MTRDPATEPGLRKTHLIRELVDLSRFTEGILRTMGSAVVAVGADGLIRYVNPAAERLLDRPAAELLQTSAATALTTRGESDLAGFAAENPHALGEVDLALGDDRFVTVEVRLSPYASEDGAPDDGFVAILTDLTDVKAAQAMARRKEQLASLGELSAGVAHEIRNPLSGIGASAQLIQSRLAEEDRNQKLVQVILDESKRLNRIVDSLLDFSRPPQPRLKRTNVASCVEHCVGLVQEDARSLGVRVEARYDSLPAVWIDPDQMQQVYLNLLRNAVEAMAEGGVLTVRAETVRRAPYVRRSRGRRKEDRDLPPPVQPTEVDWIEVAVGDTGHGMDTDTAERVFDPFFTTRPRGTGLGLAICQSIVHEHSGMITVESQEGTGTTVRVDLPVERRQASRRRT